MRLPSVILVFPGSGHTLAAPAAGVHAASLCLNEHELETEQHPLALRCLGVTAAFVFFQTRTCVAPRLAERKAAGFESDTNSNPEPSLPCFETPGDMTPVGVVPLFSGQRSKMRKILTSAQQASWP